MLRGLLVVLLVAGPLLARADEPAPKPTEPPDAAPKPAEPTDAAPKPAEPPAAAPSAARVDQPPSPKRALPDYDGMPPPATTAVEVFAWVPRIVLFPAWLVAEFVIRRPLGLLVVTAERNNWPSEIVSFFMFGTKNTGLVPTFFVDLGFRPIFGVYFFYDSDGAYSLRVRGSGTIDGFGFSIANRWKTDEAGSRLQLQGDASLSPDRTFYGLGPETLDSDIARYGFFRAGGSVSFDWYPTRGIHLAGAFGIHTNEFSDPRCCNGIPVAELPTPPPGFPNGYTTMTERVDATFDSRPPRPDEQSGLRLRLSFEHSTDLRGSGNWIRAWGTLGGFLDVGHARILGLTFTTALAAPLSGEIPFPELISFGGTGLSMPGLRTDRLFGQSAVSASFRYEWPIWVALGGTLQVECGNVFGPGYEGFDPELLRLSFAFGFRTIGEPDHNFQVLIGAGTETFAQGAALTSIRLAIGGTYGF